MILNSYGDDYSHRGMINHLISEFEGSVVEKSGGSIGSIRKQDLEDVHELLYHFFNTRELWLGSPEYQQIIQKEVSLAMEAPYLLHAILAISATHLSRIAPSERRNIVAALHYQHALRTYSAQLGKPIFCQHVDAIVGCGFMHTMLAFENISRLSTSQKVDNAGNATWLRAMQGMTVLQRTENLRPHYKNSIWLPVFLGSGGCDLNDQILRTDKVVDDSWASTTSVLLQTVCQVSNEFTSSPGSPYHQALKSLCGLMHLNSSHSSVNKFITFIGQLPAGFVQLFEQNDTKAMLIMAYWCAMISAIEQWWITDSALAECRRLCAVLDSVSSPEVRELLLFPANKCGYALGT